MNVQGQLQKAGGRHRHRHRHALVHIRPLGKTPSNRVVDKAVAELHRKAEEGVAAGSAANPIPASEDDVGEIRCI